MLNNGPHLSVVNQPVNAYLSLKPSSVIQEPVQVLPTENNELSLREAPDHEFVKKERDELAEHCKQ